MFKRTMTVAAMLALGLAFSGSAAWAAGVAASETVNGGSTASVRLGHSVTQSGTVAYDSTVYGVPLPLSAYFEQGVAYWPFKAPAWLSGNEHGAYLYAISGVTHMGAWIMQTQFRVTGTFTARSVDSAVGEITTSPNAYYDYTGTGLCGCFYEDQYQNRVAVTP